MAVLQPGTLLPPHAGTCWQAQARRGDTLEMDGEPWRGPLSASLRNSRRETFTLPGATVCTPQPDNSQGLPTSHAQEDHTEGHTGSEGTVTPRSGCSSGAPRKMHGPLLRAPQRLPDTPRPNLLGIGGETPEPGVWPRAHPCPLGASVFPAGKWEPAPSTSLQASRLRMRRA